MKQYTDLSMTELAALGEDQIEHFIEVEMAYAKVVPVPKPQEFTLEEVGLMPKVTAYKVGGLLFKNQDDAQLVSTLPMYHEDYDYSGAGYDFRWLRRVVHSVEICSYYTEEEIKGRGATLKDNRQRKEKFKEEDKKYQEYRKQAQAYADVVWEAVADARRHKAKIDAALETMAKYVRLADNDEDVAKQFFRDTYVNHPDILEAVLGEKPQEMEEEA